MIILLLLWVALTIFSIIGFLFFSDLLWDVFGQSNTIDTIAVITNFYLSNFLAMVLLRKNSVTVLNWVLILLMTGLLIAVGELYLGYYILNDIFGFGENAVLFTMLILFVFVMFYGGPLFFIKLALDQVILFINAFFDGLQKNTMDRFIARARKRRLKQEGIEKIEKAARDKKDLEDILARYPIKPKSRDK